MMMFPLKHDYAKGQKIPSYISKVKRIKARSQTKTRLAHMIESEMNILRMMDKSKFEIIIYNKNAIPLKRFTNDTLEDDTLTWELINRNLIGYDILDVFYRRDGALLEVEIKRGAKFK